MWQARPSSAACQSRIGSSHGLLQCRLGDYMKTEESRRSIGASLVWLHWECRLTVWIMRVWMQQYEEETRTRLMDTKLIWAGKDDGEKGTALSGSAAFGFWQRLLHLYLVNIWFWTWATPMRYVSHANHPTAKTQSSEMPFVAVFQIPVVYEWSYLALLFFGKPTSLVKIVAIPFSLRKAKKKETTKTQTCTSLGVVSNLGVGCMVKRHQNYPRGSQTLTYDHEKRIWLLRISDLPETISRPWNFCISSRALSFSSRGIWSSGALRFFHSQQMCLLEVTKYGHRTETWNSQLPSCRTTREGDLDGVHMHLHVDLDDSNCTLEQKWSRCRGSSFAHWCIY